MTEPMEYYPPPSNSSALGQLKAVAIGLIVSGVISEVVIAVDLAFRLYNVSSGKAAAMARGGAAPPPGFEAGFLIGLYGVAVIEVLGLILTPVMILGAIQMLRLRSYGFAKAAAILAVIPVTGVCCCITDLPFGIWALILLQKPEVKDAFGS